MPVEGSIPHISGIEMYGNSVPVESVGGRLGAVLAANPMTQIVDAYRAVLLYGRLPDGPAFAATAVLSLVVLLASWQLFHRAEFKFAENI